MSAGPKGLFCLPMETKVRDLDPRLYVALKCAARGWAALVGSKAAVADACLGIEAPFNYLGVSCGFLPEGLEEHMRDNGSALMSLDEEGGVWEKGATTLRYRYNRDEIAKNRLVFLWSRDILEAVLEQYPDLDPGRFLVTGNPRFDLCKPPFAPYYLGLRKGRREIKKPFVLVNSNAGVGNPSIELEAAIQYALTRPGLDFDEQDCRDRAAFKRRALDVLADGVLALAERHPELTFLVRPHPSEGLDYYHDRLGHMPNIVTNAEGCVQEWIADAVCVIHQDCTTAIEAFLFDKPVISYMDEEDPRFVQFVPPLISERATGPDQLLALFDELLSNGRPQDPETRARRVAVIKQVADNADGNATDAIVRAMAEHGVAWSPGQSWRPAKAGLSRKLKAAAGRVLGSALRAKGDAYTGRGAAKFPGLSLAEVRARIDLMRGVDHEIPDVVVTPCQKDCFLIQTAEGTR